MRCHHQHCIAPSREEAAANKIPAREVNYRYRAASARACKKTPGDNRERANYYYLFYKKRCNIVLGYRLSMCSIAAELDVAHGSEGGGDNI